MLTNTNNATMLNNKSNDEKKLCGIKKNQLAAMVGTAAVVLLIVALVLNTLYTYNGKMDFGSPLGVHDVEIKYEWKSAVTKFKASGKTKTIKYTDFDGKDGKKLKHRGRVWLGFGVVSLLLAIPSVISAAIKKGKKKVFGGLLFMSAALLCIACIFAATYNKGSQGLPDPKLGTSVIIGFMDSFVLFASSFLLLTS